MPNGDVVVILVTAPSRDAADRVSRALLEDRLVACANIVPAVRSLFWWEGALEEADESLIILKARRSDVSAITDRVRAVHPYDVPEVLALDVAAGMDAYLTWVHSETERGDD